MASATVRRRDTLALIILQPRVSGATRIPARPADRLARQPPPVAKSGASASAPCPKSCRPPVSGPAPPIPFRFELAVLNVNHRIARGRLNPTYYGFEELHPSRPHLSPTCSILRARVVASSMNEKKASRSARTESLHTSAFRDAVVRCATAPHTGRGLRLWPSSTSQSKSKKYAVAPGGMHADAPASSAGPRSPRGCPTREQTPPVWCVARPQRATLSHAPNVRHVEKISASEA